MACFNFRLKNGWSKEKIIQFFQDMGYNYRDTNKKSIKKGNDYILTEEFIRNRIGGRNHIFIEFGRKFSGTHFPRMKIYAHYDIIKIKNGKERHYPDKTEFRNIKEMHNIHKKLKSAKLGFMEEKDKNCAHGTIDLNEKEKLIVVISKDYSQYNTVKYRKKISSIQYVLQIIEQYKYVHIICVCAFIASNKCHILKKHKAIKELNRIIDEMKNL